jgi:hypothetical protein
VAIVFIVAFLVSKEAAAVVECQARLRQGLRLLPGRRHHPRSCCWSVGGCHEARTRPERTAQPTL